MLFRVFQLVITQKIDRRSDQRVIFFISHNTGSRKRQSSQFFSLQHAFHIKQFIKSIILGNRCRVFVTYHIFFMPYILIYYTSWNLSKLDGLGKICSTEENSLSHTNFRLMVKRLIRQDSAFDCRRASEFVNWLLNAFYMLICRNWAI